MIDHEGLNAATKHFATAPIFQNIESNEFEVDNYDLFAIAIAKRDRLKSLLKNLASAARFQLMVFTEPPNLALAAPRDDRIEKTLYLKPATAIESVGNASKSHNPTILWLTNNVVAQLGFEYLLNLKQECPDCLIVVQDYDNHHWYRMSAICMLLSDIYVPSHYHTPPFAQHLLVHTFKVIPIGSIQWREAFLLANIHQIASTTRINQPKGTHTPYNRFPYRNKLVGTLNQNFSEVRFSQDQSFHHLSEEGKLLDWIQAKLHYIVPVGHDIPIRFFDALITGGLPLIPEKLESKIQLMNVPSDYYLTYNINDIIAPMRNLDNWIKHFDQMGPTGAIERFSFAMKNFHVNAIASAILDFLIELSSKESKTNYEYP